MVQVMAGKFSSLTFPLEQLSVSTGDFCVPWAVILILFFISFVSAAYAAQSFSDSTHVCLEKINTLRNVRLLVVHHKGLVHRPHQHHLNLSMHHVGQNSGRKFHAENDEQQEGELER